MAKRGKTQARRNQGNGGLPGWAWGVLGLVIGIMLILVAPKYLKSDGDGFFRPRPNPDAQPAPVESADDELGVPDEGAGAAPGDDTATPPRKQTDFDFYTLLPGREVPLSDAELAETARVEAQRDAKAAAATAAAATGTDATADVAPGAAPLPAPVDDAAPAADENRASTPAPSDATPSDEAGSDDTRYLLQAGAFEASGQAEELKAKIAMLGVGARVESAQIKGKTVFRVRMGPYGSAGELAEAKRKLASGGLPAMAIKVE